MRIQAIEATREGIALRMEGAPAENMFFVRETVATVGPQPGRELSRHRLAIHGCALTISRFEGDHDRLFSAFDVYDGPARVEGVRYVTDLADDVPPNRAAYPQPDTIKALSATDEDIRSLGLGQTLTNINLPAFMAMQEAGNTLPYVHDGGIYYFLREKVEALDAFMRHMDEMGLTVTMILLNAPRLFDSAEEPLLLDTVIHPGFDEGCPEAYISAFNMRTEEGQRFYRAFVSFLAERYTRADRQYGRAVGAIIGNEVDSQYVWGNAGEMACGEYALEYTQAMRLAWLCGRKNCGHFRVYASLDHYWHGLTHNVCQPLRYYPGRAVVEAIRTHAARDGDFPWGVAHHPYPEDLRRPDFWNDRSPDFTFTTPRITFKNIEMLPAYLSQPQLHYKGRPRRVILSEQGFNSLDGDMAAISEAMGAAGYCLAYEKIRALETVDLFTHHAYVDNPREFGLNLGIRRYDPSTPHNAGEAKPIYASIRAMDTPAEAQAVANARAFIGEALYDLLLHPRITYGDRNGSRDGEFMDIQEKKARQRKDDTR